MTGAESEKRKTVIFEPDSTITQTDEVRDESQAAEDSIGSAPVVPVTKKTQQVTAVSGELIMPEDESQDAEGSADEPADAEGTEETEQASGDAGQPSEEQDAADSGEQDDKPDIDAETEAIKKKIIERKKEKRRRARRRKVRFWTVLIILVTSVAGFAFSLSGFFTVDSIEVQGNSHFTDEEVINIAHAVPGHNLLYRTDEKTITDYLMQNPYIKSVEVTRKLPSTLVITVEERTQACAFRYDDDYLIMDEDGILLRKTRTEPKVTLVTGLVVSKISLGETVGMQNKHTFSKLLKFIRATREADLYFVSVDMTTYEDDHIVRAYIYDNLMVRGDYDLFLTVFGNGRLHKVVEKLFADDVQRGTITLTDDGTISFEPGI